MDRRCFLKNCAMTAGGSVLGGCANGKGGLFKGLKRNRPNIIFLLADDQ